MKIQVNIENLAKVCADLCKQGIAFNAECLHDDEYIIVLTGF